MKEIYYIHKSQKRGTACHSWGCEGGALGSRLNQAGGELRKTVQIHGKCLCWVKSEYTAKAWGDFIGVFECHSQGSGARRKMWQGPTFSHWCTRSPGQGAHTPCLWWCWSIRKIWGFKNLCCSVYKNVNLMKTDTFQALFCYTSVPPIVSNN